MAGPSGWRPAALNNGWVYCDRVRAGENGRLLSVVMAERYRHSSEQTWLQRVAAAELSCNGVTLDKDRILAAGDVIHWQRPAWMEATIPDQWETIHDDGDVLIIDKPSGLPVMPGGGFLLHTLTALLERKSRSKGEALAPKPVHRLGRFTSGLQVCARRPDTRAELSKQFRPEGGCRKTYLAWTRRVESLKQGQTLTVTSDVVERRHPLLGWIWAPEPKISEPLRKRLSAQTAIQLRERRDVGDLLEVLISTGRPHQIRIHLAQMGCPLLGDPLYLSDQELCATATPGDGGYQLHAWRLEGLRWPSLKALSLHAQPPKRLADGDAS